MKIIFKTNIDAYQRQCFPIIEQVPRTGDKVKVNPEWEPWFLARKLPTILIVTDVIWTDAHAIVELWYCPIDVEFAQVNKINLFP